jgi:hypothetical protein
MQFEVTSNQSCMPGSGVAEPNPNEGCLHLVVMEFHYTTDQFDDASQALPLPRAVSADDSVVLDAYSHAVVSAAEKLTPSATIPRPISRSSVSACLITTHRR